MLSKEIIDLIHQLHIEEDIRNAYDFLGPDVEIEEIVGIELSAVQQYFVLESDDCTTLVPNNSLIQRIVDIIDACDGYYTLEDERTVFEILVKLALSDGLKVMPEAIGVVEEIMELFSLWPWIVWDCEWNRFRKSFSADYVYHTRLIDMLRMSLAISEERKGVVLSSYEELVKVVLQDDDLEDRQRLQLFRIRQKIQQLT